MSARVVHINDAVPGAVSIGRAVPRRRIKASKWANPHRIGDAANEWGTGREAALFAYAVDLNSPEATRRHLLAELPELRDKPLACWCRHDGVSMTDGKNGPDNRCHGDLLVRYLDQWTDDELRDLAQEGDGDA